MYRVPRWIAPLLANLPEQRRRQLEFIYCTFHSLQGLKILPRILP